MSFRRRRALLYASSLAWVSPSAIIDEIFTTGQYYPRPYATEFADVRASTAYAADTSGVWSSFLSNVTRITNAGMTNEPARTNSIRNNSMQGAGAGTPGTPPTNWTMTTASGISRQIIGTGTLNGVDYIDVRFFGTGTGIAAQRVYFDAGATIAASNGATWSLSNFLQLVSGSVPSGFFFGWDETGPGTTFIKNDSQTVTPDANFTRYNFPFTLNGGVNVAFLLPQLGFNSSNGGVVDFTIRIGWPQLELGASVLSPIRTTTAAATRAADAITIQRTGIGRVVFTFDDNSQQTVSGISTAAQYTLSTTLNRAIIKRLTGYAV